MDCLAIFQRDDSQVLSKLGNINPVTDSAVILYFPSDRGIDGLDAPFHANIDALLEHVIAEIVGGFGVLHSAPLRLYLGRFSPAGKVNRLSGATLGERVNYTAVRIGTTFPGIHSRPDSQWLRKSAQVVKAFRLSSR